MSSKNPLINKLLCCVATFLAAAMTVMPASAADDEADDLIEEIVVTATYRDTDMMDTPITITALTDVEIDQKGVEDIKSLYISIPGLNYGNATNTWHNIVARGVPQFRSPTGPIAIYIDNTPVSGAGNRQPLLPNFDLERIEVLKGPQGSLYGEGSMVGAVRYITKRPDPTGLDFAFKSRIEDQTQSSDVGHRVDAMANIPLGDQVALRATLYSRHKPGLIDQYGPTITKDVDSVEEEGYRAQISWYPTDGLTLTAVAYSVDADIGGPGIAFHCYSQDRPADSNVNPSDRVASVPNFPVVGGCETGPNGAYDGETARFKRGPDHVYVTHMAAPGYEDGGNSTSEIFNFNLEWEVELPLVGEAIITAATSTYEHSIFFSEEQRTGSRNGTVNPKYTTSAAATAEVTRIQGLCMGIPTCAAALPEGETAFWARSSVRAHADVNERNAHELRIVSNSDGAFQWTVGVFDQDLQSGSHPGVWGPCGASHRQAQVPYNRNEFTDVVCQGGGWIFNPAISLADQRLIHQRLRGTRGYTPGYNLRDEIAWFGEVSWRINDQFELLFGARRAEMEFERRQGAFGSFATLAETTRVGELQKQTKTAPKFTATWRPNDDWMIFATVAEAFRSGGINTGLGNQHGQYKDACARGIGGACSLADASLGLLTFQGDNVDSTEIGFKGTLLDGRLDIMFSAYQTSVDNAVVTTSISFEPIVDPDNPNLADQYSTNVNANVGKAESNGFEIEFRGQLTDQIRISGGGAYVPDAEVLTGQRGGAIGTQGNFGINIQEGNRIAYTPVHSYFASAMYDFDLYGWDSTLRADWFYRGKEVFRTENNERPTPTYFFINTKLIMRQNNYEFGAYIKNITDEIAPFSIGDSGYHGFHPPRSFGLEFTWRYE